MRGSVGFLLLALLGFPGCADDETPEAEQPPITVPSGFPDLVAPEDNEPTRARIELGRRLFYDERLSSTEEVACASCHLQEHAFADPNRVSVGVEGRTGTRNAPALINMAWGKSFFWHGGVSSLEVQAVAPIKNPLEMDMTLAAAAERLSADPAVLEDFERAYEDVPSESTITRALASFGRSLISGNSPYDRYVAGDMGALSEAALRGQALFNGESGECFHCHNGFNFSNNGFRNNGSAADDPDEGRREITLKDSDLGRFKVPTLRNVAVSAPYMHDGSLATLAEVVATYVQGGRCHANTDPTIQPLELDEGDQLDLLAFLEALTDQEFLTNPQFADPEQ
jgi:cytochrome c peroxidase